MRKELSRYKKLARPPLTHDGFHGEKEYATMPLSTSSIAKEFPEGPAEQSSESAYNMVSWPSLTIHSDRAVQQEVSPQEASYRSAS